MSICRNKKLKCPGCGRQVRAMYWDSINVQCDPEARETLLRGDLHKFECPQCHKVICVEKSFLYHDMNIEFMVWFYPFKRIENFDFFDEFTEDGTLDCSAGLADNDVPAYSKNVHYVFSMDEMVRYIKFRE